MAAWTADGGFLWALRQGGNQHDSLRAIAAFTGQDGRDILVVGGCFQNYATYGTSSDDQVTFTSATVNEDLILLRFDREAE